MYRIIVSGNFYFDVEKLPEDTLEKQKFMKELFKTLDKNELEFTITNTDYVQ